MLAKSRLKSLTSQSLTIELMELLQLDIFDDDLNSIDNSLKQRLKKAIVKIRENPRLGKPLKHYADIFSERVGKFRLVYKFQNQEITLI